MKKTTRIAAFALGIIFGVNVPSAIHAQETNSNRTLFKFDVGLAFASGAYDIKDALADSFRDNGYVVDEDFVFPIGLTLTPHIEFANGLGVGLSIGPGLFTAVERTDFSGTESDISFVIPVGAFVQYNLMRDADISPYVRAGVRYPIAGGDYVEAESVGAFGVVGVEFRRHEGIGWGIEVGYDSSQATVSAGPLGPERKIEPVGFTLGVFARF